MFLIPSTFDPCFLLGWWGLTNILERSRVPQSCTPTNLNVRGSAELHPYGFEIGIGFCGIIPPSIILPPAAAVEWR